MKVSQFKIHQTLQFHGGRPLLKPMKQSCLLFHIRNPHLQDVSLTPKAEIVVVPAKAEITIV